MKFRVDFCGFAYIEADSAEEIESHFDLDDAAYVEMDFDNISEVEEFAVCI